MKLGAELGAEILHLMSIMHVGFKRIAPDQDTSMNLNDPRVTALGFFNAGERSPGTSKETIPDANLSLGKSVFETIDAIWEITN